MEMKTPPGSPKQTQDEQDESMPAARQRHSPPVRSPAGRQLATPDDKRNQQARRRTGEKPDEVLDDVEDADADADADADTGTGSDEDVFAGVPPPPSAPTAAAARAPVSEDGALEVLKDEFRRGEDDDDWALNEDNWSERPGLRIMPSDTWGVSIRGVPVGLASVFAPAEACDPDVRPPLVVFDDPRTLRSERRPFFRRHIVAARALLGLNNFEELLGKPPPSRPRSSSFSSSEEDEASAEDEATARRFWIGGPPGVGTLTHVEPSYLDLRAALPPDKAGDAQLLRALGSPAGAYHVANAPPRPPVEVLLPDADAVARAAASNEAQALNRDAEARRNANAAAARKGELNVQVFNAPCRQGSKCRFRNVPNPAIRCRYIHTHTHDYPLLYKFNCEPGEWSDTDFKKALDSGVMRDSVTGERVSVVPGSNSFYKITFANGNEAKRRLKQLRVLREGDS